MSNRFEAAAVEYATLGYAVFPCKPRGKLPLTTHGYQDATRDERQILQWWDRWPDANIGIACGASGIVVFDADSKHGADPRELLDRLAFEPTVWTGEAPPASADLPDSLEGVLGAHVYFAGDLPTVKTSIKGVELRGQGAYVIAPPSVHPSGVVYEGTLPAVADLSHAIRHGLGQLIPAGATDTTPIPGDDDEVEPGGRHEALLAWARSRYTAKGVLGQAALDGMRGHNLRVCKPPLDDAEVVRLWKHLEKTRIAEAERLLVKVELVREVVTYDFSELGFRPTKFLWYPYLPLGKVVIVAGAPGHGKSQLAALMAGMVSRGAFPGDVQEPSRALMLCAEDDLAEAVGPRLMAINADLRRVTAMDVRTTYPNGLVGHSPLRIPSDAEHIDRWARKHPDARLVVMDPVASFFDRSHSTFINQDVRDALGPVIALAAHFGITIVLILHLNKSESRDFAARIAESHGFQAVARSVLALAPDPDDPDGERGSRKILAVTKANLIKPGNYGMRCELRSVTLTAGLPEPISTSELVLTGKCEIAADDLLMSVGERSTRLEVAGWLAEFVGDHWVKTGDVKKAAISDGFSWRTVERVRSASGYKRAKEPGTEHGPWWIAAPTTPGGTPPTGGHGGVEGKDANTARDWGGSEAGLGLNGNGESPNANRQDPTINDLDEYRRFEQRKLGERDDDDE